MGDEYDQITGNRAPVCLDGQALHLSRAAHLKLWAWHHSAPPPELLTWLSLLADMGTPLPWSGRLTGIEKALGLGAASPKEDQVALAAVPG